MKSRPGAQVPTPYCTEPANPAWTFAGRIVLDWSQQDMTQGDGATTGGTDDHDYRDDAKD